MPTEKQQIRKYANRKLYHVARAGYVSMLELSDMVAGGAAVEVVDDQTGRDLTIETLARSLYERVKDGDLPASELRARDLSRLIAKVTRRSQE